MKHIIRLILSISLSSTLYSCQHHVKQEVKNYTQYVNPFIGSTGKGHVFPGASLPFSMVKIGPDYYDLSTNSGYKKNKSSEDLVVGFSHVHVSGTGGGPKYGNIRFTPFVNQVAPDPAYFAINEEATPGYYGVTLTKGERNEKGKRIIENPIRCEFSLSDSAAFHKYKFPETENARIFINAGSLLGHQHCCDEQQILVSAEVKYISETEISGFATAKGGWNMGSEYTVYFYAVFNRPVEKMNQTKDSKLTVKFSTKKDKQIQCHVGISFKDFRKAKENAYSFKDWDFLKTCTNAQDQWNKILSKIEIKTNDVLLKRNFYSALYRSYLMPTNRTHNNSILQGIYFDDYYAIWDTYRTTDPLRLLLTPEIHSKILNTLINLYEQEGYFLDARSGDYSGRTQGGSNVDLLFSEAMIKGVENIDYEMALKYLVDNSNNSVFTENDSNLKTKKDSVLFENKFGRPSITQYVKYGYIPADTLENGEYKYSLAGSRTMEYSYNDFGIYQVANQLYKENPNNYNYKALRDEFFNRALNYRNILNIKYDFQKMKGTIVPKFSNGQWFYGDKKIFKENGTWGDFLYEGTSPEYTLFAPHDILGLINFLGDTADFMKRLDHFHYNKIESGTDKTWFNVANEPSFLTPYLYHWLGFPDKSAKRVREIIEDYYYASSDGLPGNDDAAAMGAWFIFNTMGFYPLAGTDIYLIGSPSFTELVINLENGKQITITANNLSDKNIYVNKLTYNGKNYSKSWFTHDMLMNGCKFHFEMDSIPSNIWGKESLPYSLTK